MNKNISLANVSLKNSNKEKSSSFFISKTPNFRPRKLPTFINKYVFKNNSLLKELYSKKQTIRKIIKRRTKKNITKTEVRQLEQSEILQNIKNLALKSDRTIEDNVNLTNYLLQLKSFITNIREILKEKFRQFLLKIAPYFQYKKYNTHDIIYHSFEPVDNFYMLLKGSASLISPKEISYYLTDLEFYYYLLRLRMMNEKGLIESIINKNINFYPNLSKGFDYWLRRAFLTVFQIHINDPQKKFDMEEVKRQLNEHDLRPGQGILGINLHTCEPFEQSDLINLIKNLEQVVVSVHNTVFFSNNTNDNINSIDRYISRIKADDIIESLYKNKHLLASRKNDKRKKIILYKYFMYANVSDGEFFGDMTADLLSKKDVGREESIFCCSDCELLYIDKGFYVQFVRDIMDSYKAIKTISLGNINLFQGMKCSKFLRSYAMLFEKTRFNKGDVIFEENQRIFEDSQYIYMIIKGKVEISLSLSLKKINDFLYGTNKLNKKEEKKDTKHDLPKLEQLEVLPDYNNNSNFLLSFSTDGDILGLKDCYIEDKYLFTAKVASDVCDVYKIHYNFYNKLINNNSYIYENAKKFEKEKITIFLELLNKQRRKRIKRLMIKYPKFLSKNYGIINKKKINCNYLKQNNEFPAEENEKNKISNEMSDKNLFLDRLKVKDFRKTFFINLPTCSLKAINVEPKMFSRNDNELQQSYKCFSTQNSSKKLLNLKGFFKEKGKTLAKNSKKKVCLHSSRQTLSLFSSGNITESEKDLKDLKDLDLKTERKPILKLNITNESEIMPQKRIKFNNELLDKMSSNVSSRKIIIENTYETNNNLNNDLETIDICSQKANFEYHPKFESIESQTTTVPTKRRRKINKKSIKEIFNKHTSSKEYDPYYDYLFEPPKNYKPKRTEIELRGLMLLNNKRKKNSELYKIFSKDRRYIPELKIAENLKQIDKRKIELKDKKCLFYINDDRNKNTFSDLLAFDTLNRGFNTERYYNLNKARTIQSHKIIDFSKNNNNVEIHFRDDASDFRHKRSNTYSVDSSVHGKRYTKEIIQSFRERNKKLNKIYNRKYRKLALCLNKED